MDAEVGGGGIRGLMISKMMVLACLMHATATSLVFFKANSKQLYEVDLHPIAWWLLTGWLLETLYLNAYWKLADAASPWIDQITLAGVGTVVSLAWMSIFYGFQVKYAVSVALIFAGVAASRM